MCFVRTGSKAWRLFAVKYAGTLLRSNNSLLITNKKKFENIKYHGVSMELDPNKEQLLSLKLAQRIKYKIYISFIIFLADVNTLDRFLVVSTFRFEIRGLLLAIEMKDHKVFNYFEVCCNIL